MSLTSFISTYFHKILPPICVLCGSFCLSSSNICPYCQKNLPILSHKCVQCAQFLPSSNDTLRCGQCLLKPPPFTLTHALFSYQPPIIHLITGLKFRHQLSYAQALGELLAEKIRNEWYRNTMLPQLIVPVPLHPKRLAERGFNQAVEIARPVSKLLSLPIDINGAKRIKYTEAQSHLSALERKRNIAKAFIANHRFKNVYVAVIDDVITTGHTIKEFCKILKQSGANPIHVWCCARR